MKIEVKPADEGWGVFVNGLCIGVSKHSFDADFHAGYLRTSIQKAVDNNACIELENYPDDRTRLMVEVEKRKKDGRTRV